MPPLRLGPWIHISFWGLIVLVYSLIFSTIYPLESALWRTMANAFPLVLLFYLHNFLIDRFWERRQWGLYTIGAISLLLTLTILRIQLNLQFPLPDYHFSAWPEKNAVMVSSSLTNLGMLLFSGLFRLLQHRSEKERKSQIVINEQQAAQLQFLKAQINPHFLFNTLHNIYSLAVVGSKKTPDMVLQLSNLLRYVIYDSREGRVPLGREVEQIHRYIDLFRMRSEGPIKVEFEIPHLSRDLKVEPMVLLPLVENCFKHCDFDRNPEAFIRLNLDVQQGYLHFKSENTFDATDHQKDRIGGVGLENIQKRLALRFGDAARLETQSVGPIYHVEIQMPFFKTPKSN